MTPEIEKLVAQLRLEFSYNESYIVTHAVMMRAADALASLSAQVDTLTREKEALEAQQQTVAIDGDYNAGWNAAIERAANVAEVCGVPYGPWRKPPDEDTFSSGVAVAHQFIASAIRSLKKGPTT